MALYEYNKKNAFKFQVIGKKTLRNRLMFHLLQINFSGSWQLFRLSCFILSSYAMCKNVTCEG